MANRIRVIDAGRLWIARENDPLDPDQQNPPQWPYTNFKLRVRLRNDARMDETVPVGQQSVSFFEIAYEKDPAFTDPTITVNQGQVIKLGFVGQESFDRGLVEQVRMQYMFNIAVQSGLLNVRFIIGVSNGISSPTLTEQFVATPVLAVDPNNSASSGRYTSFDGPGFQVDCDAWVHLRSQIVVEAWMEITAVQTSKILRDSFEFAVSRIEVLM